MTNHYLRDILRNAGKLGKAYDHVKYDIENLQMGITLWRKQREA